MTTKLIETKLKLILTKVLLKFELVLQKNLNQQDQPLSLEENYLKEGQIQEQEQEQEQEETTENNKQKKQIEKAPEIIQQEPQGEPQIETITPSLETTQTQTLPGTPTNSPPPSPTPSSQASTIIQTHPEEPSTNTTTTYHDHQNKPNEPQQEKPNPNPNPQDHQNGPHESQQKKSKPNSNPQDHQNQPSESQPKKPKPNPNYQEHQNRPNESQQKKPKPKPKPNPTTKHQQPNDQTFVSHTHGLPIPTTSEPPVDQNPVLKPLDQNSSKQSLLKRIRVNESIPQRKRSKKKRRQQRDIPEYDGLAQRLTPHCEQGITNYNTEMRSEFMNNMPVPIDDRPANPPGAMVGDLLRWGETRPASGYPTHPQPPPQHYDPPPHQVHPFINFEEPQPYLTRPNGYNRYAVSHTVPDQYTSFPPEAYYPASDADPSHPNQNPHHYPTDHDPSILYHPFPPALPAPPIDPTPYFENRYVYHDHALSEQAPQFNPHQLEFTDVNFSEHPVDHQFHHPHHNYPCS